MRSFRCSAAFSLQRLVLSGVGFVAVVLHVMPAFYFVRASTKSLVWLIYLTSAGEWNKLKLWSAVLQLCGVIAQDA